MIFRWRVSSKVQSGLYYGRTPFVQVRVSVAVATDLFAEFYGKFRKKVPIAARRTKTFTPAK